MRVAEEVYIWHRCPWERVNSFLLEMKARCVTDEGSLLIQMLKLLRNKDIVVDSIHPNISFHFLKENNFELLNIFEV